MSLRCFPAIGNAQQEWKCLLSWNMHFQFRLFHHVSSVESPKYSSNLNQPRGYKLKERLVDGKKWNKIKQKTDPELNFFKWVFFGNILFRLVIYGEWKRGLRDEREENTKGLQEVSRNFFSLENSWNMMVRGFNFSTWLSDSFCHLPRHYLDNQFVLRSWEFVSRLRTE